MKFNRIIAGLGVVAGLGVALAPVASFAYEPVTGGVDNLEVTVKQGCSLKPASGAGEFTAFDEDYTANVVPGNDWTITAGAGSAFKIACNAGARYTITATGTALTHTDHTTTLASSTYGVKVTHGSTADSDYRNLENTVTIADSVVHSGTDVNFAVNSYEGSTQGSTKAGVYSGTVTYAVTFLDAE